MNISDRIQALRKARGITQETLADALGVSRQAVSKWESEQATPDLERVVDMCEYFGVTADYLLRGIEPAPEGRPARISAQSLSVIATTLDFCVLVAAAVWWRLNVTGWACALALMGHAVGLAMWILSGEGRPRWFPRLNVWLFALAPAYAVFFIGNSYLVGGDAALFIAAALYLAVCAAVSVKFKK